MQRFEGLSKVLPQVVSKKVASKKQAMLDNWHQQELLSGSWLLHPASAHEIRGWTYTLSKKSPKSAKRKKDLVKPNLDRIVARGGEIDTVTLQIRTIIPKNSPTKEIETFIVSAIHGNETEISKLLCGHFLTNIQTPSVLVPRANLTSGKNNHRHLVDDKGQEIDLNRQFLVHQYDKNWESVMSKAGCLEAKLLYSALLAHPDVKTIVSFHQDNDHGWNDESKNLNGLYKGKNLKTDGFYMYDIVGKRMKDSNQEKIEILKKQIMEEVKKHGFDIFNGVDAHDLKNKADSGIINESIIQPDGTFRVDGSFESASVALGLNGINQVERAFVFEIPGGLSKKRKAELLNIIQKEFLNNY